MSVHFSGRFVTAVNRHGVKQVIPRHWLDDPVLGAGFRLPASQVSADRVSGRGGDPSSDWTRAELAAHAATRGVEVPERATKAELLDAIAATSATLADQADPVTPDANPAFDETPDAGDDPEGN